MVRIVTTTCPSCETIVAGNVLADARELRCPGPDCQTVLRFDDLPEADRRHLERSLDRYRRDQ